MCRRIQCEDCNKPTYAGCGMHVEQVLGDVSPSQRCECRNAPAIAGADKTRAREPGWKFWRS